MRRGSKSRESDNGSSPNESDANEWKMKKQIRRRDNGPEYASTPAGGRRWLARAWHWVLARAGYIMVGLLALQAIVGAARDYLRF